MNSVDAANLREQAAHSRRLADMIGDERASRALMELAEEYEAKAAAAGRSVAGSPVPGVSQGSRR